MARFTWTRADRADQALDEFDAASSAQDIYLGTRRWSTRELVSAAVRRVFDAGGGGPGGSTPTLAQVLAEGASAGNLAIEDLADPSSDQDAVTRRYFDDQLALELAAIPTPLLEQILAVATSAGGFKITDLDNPVANQDAATKAYVDSVAGAQQFTSIPVSSAELLALHTTPKELLPAPGGRLYHVIHGFVFHYRHVSTPYAYDSSQLSTALMTMWGNTLPSYAGAYFLPLHLDAGNPRPSRIFQATDDIYTHDTVSGSANLVAYAWDKDDIEDQPINLVIDPAIMPDGLEDGDGTLTIRLWYSTIDGAPPE